MKQEILDEAKKWNVSLQKEIAEELGYDMDYDFLVKEAEKFKIKHNISTCNINLSGEIDSPIIQLSFLVERTEAELTEGIRKRKIASNTKLQRLREARENISFVLEPIQFLRD